MIMAYPESVADRTVVIGGGVHGGVYAATYYKLTGKKVVVLEKRDSLGGILGWVSPFMMNSVHNASIQSVMNGPSRIPSTGDSDSLNYIPNSEFQVDSAGEYPGTDQMADAVRDTIRTYADWFVNTEANIDYDGDVFATNDGERYLGAAKRIICATGLSMPERREYSNCAAYVSAEDFLRHPQRAYGRSRVAVAVWGGGDTAATCVETLLGQSMTKFYGIKYPTEIHWFGGPGLPSTKKEWARDYHARYIGISRHMPQSGITGIIHPYPKRVTPVSLGGYLQIEGRSFDLVIDATGFKANRVSGVTLENDVKGVSGRTIARSVYGNTTDLSFSVGPCAGIPRGPLDPYPSKFGASAQAIYATAPRTAELAAIHAAYDVNGS